MPIYYCFQYCVFMDVYSCVFLKLWLVCFVSLVGLFESKERDLKQGMEVGWIWDEMAVGIMIRIYCVHLRYAPVDG